MACSVHIADEASESLARSVEYVAFVLKEPRAASEMLDDFDAFVKRVSEMPETYPTCRDARLSALRIRKAPIKKYIALYRVDEESRRVDVVAFFHQTQDYTRLV